jgi:hypothetical protein
VSLFYALTSKAQGQISSLMTECKDDFQTGMREYLKGCTLNGHPSSSMRGYIDGSITGAGGMPLNPTTDDVVVYQRNPAYTAREKQLMINLLGLEGGRPYVNTRLSRYSGETEIDWVGGSRPDGSSSTGRLQQTHAFPYLGRIDNKINQYVFQEEPKREGGDDDVINDISRDSSSVNDLMRQVSSYLLACKWCWIMVDAPERKEDGEDFTIEEKVSEKIRPYWQVLSPLDVLDWNFNEKGVLQWVKTQSVEYDNSDPFSIPTAKRIIKLWGIGKCIKYTIVEKKDGRRSNGKRIQVESEEIPLTDAQGNPLKVVPFTLVGDISAKPIAFDDLESINRTIMDLGSVDRSSYFNGNYPQLVLPRSLMTNAMQDNYGSVGEQIRLMLGFKYPLMVDADDKDPKYISPDASALKGGSEYTAQLKRELFEVVGLALEQDSKQVASGESKA